MQSLKITLTNQGVEEALRKHFIEMYDFENVEVIVDLVPYNQCEKITAEITINGIDNKSETTGSQSS